MLSQPERPVTMRPMESTAPFSELPPFRPRMPWLGADLQTVRNLLRGPVVRPPAETGQRVRFPMADGDVLSGRLDEPSARRPGRPLVVLIHGLSGCEDSAYVLASSAFWLDEGHHVLRLNLRGAGPTRAECRDQYHAGRSEDLRTVLTGLPPGLDRDGLLLVGYSLGGNMLLKFLAEHGAAFPIAAAASVSAPIDLAASSHNFLRPRNAVYHRWLLGSMRREALGDGAAVNEAEVRALRDVKSIWEFDDRVVAPRNGFRDAEHYYAENHALRFLPEVRVPTLVIHALDDPWIPGSAYTAFDWAAHPALTPLLPEHGGHVGFHARDHRTPWHDRAIARFAGAIAARPSAATLAS